jgi:alanine racemase
MTFSQLASISGGKILQYRAEQHIRYLITDSRKAILSEESLFVAISGARHNGHQFVSEMYQRGVCSFMIEDDAFNFASFPEANIVLVPNSAEALQKVAAFRRSEFKKPLIAITGSNGKTIVKEWLFDLLSPDRPVIANPGSYNSQLGVPLSVWNLTPEYELGIFEAGISRPGEMEKLHQVLRPTIGLLTNIGSAHDEGFSDRNQKLDEKLKLFAGVEVLIYRHDHEEIQTRISDTMLPALSWGFGPGANIQVSQSEGLFKVTFQKHVFTLLLPFTDQASIENAFHCIAVMLHLGIAPDIVKQRVLALRPIANRLELKDGINNCQLVDDSYNNDLAGLQFSLQFLAHQKQRTRRTLILSDVLQSGLSPDLLGKEIAQLLTAYEIDRFVGVGPALLSARDAFPVNSIFFHDTHELIINLPQLRLQDELILIKGARSFQFERVVSALQKKMHGTVLEVNMDALVENLNFFKSCVNPGTRFMVMVKALAYGSGSVEIANLLRYHRVDYLGVAYADEGIDLRNNHIDLPIMVMNPTEESLDAMFAYNLEPEVYSLSLLHSTIAKAIGNPVRIHLKLDTGMSRLGFRESELTTLTELLIAHRNIEVVSIFSHLAGSDEAEHDPFSHQQAKQFINWASYIADRLTRKPLLHLLNSSGILRFPEYQFDMVRLGIGLYGVGDPRLKPVTRLRSTISQVRQLAAGETVGYGRSYKTSRPMQVATIAIGYADGFSRAFSNGVGKVLIHGVKAPIVGRVCMDMSMIDVTGLEVKEGDEVTIFGGGLPIEEVAVRIHTIPYEILTHTSSRVRRVFVAGGI